jgi:hypothetical protein
MVSKIAPVTFMVFRSKTNAVSASPSLIKPLLNWLARAKSFGWSEKTYGCPPGCQVGSRVVHEPSSNYQMTFIANWTSLGWVARESTAPPPFAGVATDPSVLSTAAPALLFTGSGGRKFV